MSSRLKDTPTAAADDVSGWSQSPSDALSDADLSVMKSSSSVELSLSVAPPFVSTALSQFYETVSAEIYR
jgi:hypothetical protein